MITLLIGAVVGLIVGLVCYKKFNFDAFNSLGTVFACVTLFFFISLIGGKCVPRNWVEINEIELYALSDTSITSGSFFLGCGDINSEPHYIYYKKDGNGFMYGQVSAYKSRIYEDETLKNRGFIKVFSQKFADPTHRRFFDEDSIKIRRFYEIHIPKGSLERNFKLDLQ